MQVLSFREHTSYAAFFRVSGSARGMRTPLLLVALSLATLAQAHFPGVRRWPIFCFKIVVRPASGPLLTCAHSAQIPWPIDTCFLYPGKPDRMFFTQFDRAYEFDLASQQTISNVTLRSLIPLHPAFMDKRWQCAYRWPHNYVTCERLLQFERRVLSFVPCLRYLFQRDICSPDTGPLRWRVAIR
jgi:hypothetical protein